MKLLLAVMITLALGGCLKKPFETVGNRYGFVACGNGFGSAVNVGGGRFLTAAHVINPGFGVASRYGMDSVPMVVVIDGDMALIQTRILPQEPVEFDSVELGQTLYFVQVVMDSSIELYYHEAKVMRITTDGFYVDKAVFPGCSGTGVWTREGKLVGILTRMVTMGDQSFGGFALKIPDWMKGGAR